MNLKTNLKSCLLSLILLGFIAFSITTVAQAPPPPPVEKGSATNKAPGGGAPIDGGLYGALVLVACFGAWKWVHGVQKEKQVTGR
jgi:hypothetical protein